MEYNELAKALMQTQAFQDLQKQQPDNVYLADDILNGLNKGSQAVAQWQAENNIRIPQTQADIELAQAHSFNLPNEMPTIQETVANGGVTGGSAPLIQSGVSDKTKFWDEFRAGYKDNYENPIASANFEPNPEKTWQNRLGEGVGTVMRFVDSPLGRGLLAGGLMSLAGVNNGLALGGGIAAGTNFQNNISADKLYRNQLNAMGIDTSNIYGNITADQFRQILALKQLNDNSEWRKLNIETQQAQNEIMNNLRRDQAEWQKEYQQQVLRDKQDQRNFQASENAANRAVTMRGQDFSRQSALDRIAADAAKVDRKAQAQLQQGQKTISTINTALNTVKNNPNAFGFAQGALPAPVSNRVYGKGTQARSVINSVSAEYRKYLTGAQMGDRERKDYEKFLPAPTDNAKIINDKLNGMLMVISAREGIDANTPNTPKQVVKWKVVK